jgi:hypothetical protein
MRPLIAPPVAARRSLLSRARAPFAIAALGVASFAAGCGSGSGGGGAPSAAPMAPDQISFQSTWKGDTVVIDAATAKAKLQNPGATDGVYRFDPSLTEVASLKAGQALVIEGVDLVKVDSVQTTSGATVVTTEPASLLDAATDADAKWDVGIDMSKAATGAQDAPGVRIEAVPAPSGSLSYNGPLGNLSANESMQFDADGALEMKSLVSFKSGSATMKIAADCVLKSFRADGDVIVKNGALQEAYFEVDDIDMTLDFNIGAVALGASNDTFSLPVTIKAPVPIGPIPTYVAVSATLSLNPSLSDTSSSITHASFHLLGKAGVRVVNGVPSAYGDLGSSTASTMDSQAVSTINAGLGVELEFPRVSFGVGISQAGGELYTSMKSEIVANEVMRYDGTGLINGNCLTINGDFGTFAGGAIRLAGLKLSKELEGWGKQTTVYQAGNPNDQVCKDVGQ